MRSIAGTAAGFTSGARSRALVEDCLARIKDPAGEGRRVFLKVHAEAALAAADYCDRLRARGAAPSPFAGIPVSIKDLFDVAGDVTTAGSVVLRDAPPAARDAPAVARLRAAGFIPIGRSNMTEFAFSGLGINPHYDTPRNPHDRKGERIPGGSSSGAAVSVTDGMALAALGTDTGGSCRIPAALRKAGARIDEIALRELDELPRINAKGGLAAAESYAIHRAIIAKGEKLYDPRVLARILRGREQDAADYIDLVAARAEFIRRLEPITAPYDALLMPTVPVIAPPLAELAADAAYRRVNALVLRNPAIANFLDRCAISIPCQRAGDAPVGLMLIGEHDGDRRLLSIAAAIEPVVSPNFPQPG